MPRLLVLLPYDKICCLFVSLFLFFYANIYGKETTRALALVLNTQSSSSILIVLKIAPYIGTVRTGSERFQTSSKSMLCFCESERLKRSIDIGGAEIWHLRELDLNLDLTLNAMPNA